MLTCNSEVNGAGGGVSAVRFGADGEPASAYRILKGTKWNCAGGATPWGTWLSCEEFRNGMVWECDPFKPGQGVARKAIGVRPHEAAPTDPATGIVYLTEDDHEGRLYRFIPDRYGDLSSGGLFAAQVGAAARDLDPGVAEVARAREGHDAVRPRGGRLDLAREDLYFSTMAMDRVWELDLATQVIGVIYDGQGANAGDALHEPDNVTIHERTGHGVRRRGRRRHPARAARALRNGLGRGAVPAVRRS